VRGHDCISARLKLDICDSPCPVPAGLPCIAIHAVRALIWARCQSLRPQAQAQLMTDESPADIIGAPPARAPRRGAVAFIFVTILLDMFTLGLILPILPKLVESFVDNDTASAARIFGLFGTAWALMQFFFSPILGGLSDRFGRRPVVLLSNLGLALDYVLMALAPSLTWLFVGRVISGITSASVSTAFAYIADVTPAEQRAAMFGKVGVAFGAGFVLGPAVGGLLGGMDPRLPFWVAAGLSFANTLYGLLILPESLPPDRRSPFRWKSANPLGALDLLRSDRILTGLSVVHFLAQVAHVVLPSTFVLYATYRYGWDTTTVGLTLAMVGICSIAVQGVAIGPIVQRFGERRALLLGLGCGAVGFLIFGAAPTGPLFWLGIPVMALWGVAGAASQALTTQLVAPNQQGQLQGATNSVQSVSQLVGPFLFTLTFAYFIGNQAPLKLPGAPFLLAAALMVLALLIAVRTLASGNRR
jgi:DHA1 family tetracycline resistance protein-like MFS transporter